MKLAILLLTLASSLAAQSVTPELAQYLQLTQDQINQLNANLEDYGAAVIPTWDRITKLRSEIEAITSTEPVDTTRLGVCYGELDKIDKFYKEQKLIVLRKNLSLLTPGQDQLLNSLFAANKLESQISEAESFHLLPCAVDNTTRPYYLNVISQPFPQTFLVKKCYPNSDLLMYALLDSYFSFTYVPNPVSEELRNQLQLTPEQTEQISRLGADFLNLVSSKINHMVEVQSEINSLTVSEPLDPVRLGYQYAEIENTRRLLRDQELALINTCRALLNAPQLERAKALENARTIAPLYFDLYQAIFILY